jgi:long-subunit fatty acid transport protein
VWAICLCAIFFCALSLGADSAYAGGFEIPENTTKSVGRGGTGAVNKRDPSALYFNPALLHRADGVQVLLNVNFVNLNVDFQRDPLRNPDNRRNPVKTFDPVNNENGFFPAPFLTASWDLGIENLTVGAGVFGPSAYGGRCFGVATDDGCEPDEDSAGRYMLITSSLLEFSATLGAGYQIELPYGNLSVGLSGAATYLDSDFHLAIHGNIDREEFEDPANDAIFYGRGLSDWAMSGTVGLAYDLDGFRVAASYRPPFSWEAEGTAEMEPAEDAGIGDLTDDTVTLRTDQAGALRTGVGLELGQHPADPDLPRYDIEFNFVWEDWSRVDYFRITPHGRVQVLAEEIDLGTLYQPKGYEDTFSFRLGGSYAINEWLTGHAGGFYETGAQPEEYTNLDFVSWDRFAGGLGATFRIYDYFDLDVAYQHVFSPQRTVENGRIYNQVPMHECTGPDYEGENCDGTPPGNVQNNGTWDASFQTASIGVTFHYD